MDLNIVGTNGYPVGELILRPVEEISYVGSVPMETAPNLSLVPYEESNSRLWQWGFFFLLGSLTTMATLATLGYKLMKG